MTDTKSPQLEDGFLRIANELNDVIWQAPFTHRQHKVIFAIIRKTYGYGKKEDDMSASQIGELCGLSRTHVTSTLNQLAAMNVITKKAGVYGSVLGINKYYSKWVFPSTKSVQVSQISTSTESVQGVPNQSFASTESVQVDSTESVHTKDNLPKDNKQKNMSGRPDAPSQNEIDAVAAIEYLNAKTGSKYQPVKANIRLVQARLSDGHTLDDVKAVIDAKCDEWADDERMSKYLRPKTLFNATNFENYIGGMVGFGCDGWWTAGGFETEFDAVNAGANQYNIHKFEVTA